MKYTNEELLAKAKRKYPLGTIYSPTNTSCERTITKEIKINSMGSIHEYESNGRNVQSGGVHHCIYDGNSWGTIIKKGIIDYEIF